MQLNYGFYPHTGKPVKSPIPPEGIGLSDDVLYVHHMDSWDALRRNLTALLQAAEDNVISGPTGVLQLEAAIDVGKSTLYRILDPREKNPTQLDTLERIARAYNLQAWQLLIPRLDPLDPPEVVGSQRMKVLRSVFAQTHADATNEPPTVDVTPRQPGTRTSRPADSAPAGGHPVAAGTEIGRYSRKRGPKPKAKSK